MKKIIIICFASFLYSCEITKLVYKNIETEKYFVTYYTYTNYTNKEFKNTLLVINKFSKDTLYNSYKYDYADFNLLKQDTLKVSVTTFLEEKEKVEILKDGLVIIYEKVNYNSTKNRPFPNE